LLEKNAPRIIDLSGGQPDLVPEWSLWFTDAIAARGLERELYVWSDDNLSNDFLWRYLKVEEIQRLRSRPNYGRVGCFKGFDEHSFAFNTRAHRDMFSHQFQLMRRLVHAGFDVYGYATFTSDTDKDLRTLMSAFIDRLQSEVHPLFPLRTIPLKIKEFTPTSDRIGPDQQRALLVQNDAAAAWMEELEKRFSIETRLRPIFDHQIGSVTVAQGS